MVDALIIDACRTPGGIGRAGKGALSGIHPQQLGATVLRALAAHPSHRQNEMMPWNWTRPTSAISARSA